MLSLQHSWLGVIIGVLLVKKLKVEEINSLFQGHQLLMADLKFDLVLVFKKIVFSPFCCLLNDNFSPWADPQAEPLSSLPQVFLTMCLSGHHDLLLLS